jgi:hypothetical protein
LGLDVVANEGYAKQVQDLEEQLLDPELSLAHRRQMTKRLLAYREQPNDVAIAFPCGRLLWSNFIVLREASAVFEEEIQKGRKITAYFEDGEEPPAKWSPERIKTGALDSDDEDGVTEYDSPRRAVIRIEATDASVKSYEALLTYIQGGTFSFSRIKSAKALSAQDKEALVVFDIES